MDPMRRYWFPVLGYNYRLTNVAAAIGCAQLERFQAFIEERRRIAALYEARLAPRASQLCIQLPSEAPWAHRVHWLYSVRVPSQQRDALMAHLAENRIETRPFFPPMHTLPIHERPEPFPRAEELGATGLNLPTWHGVSEDDIDRVCRCVLAFLESEARS